MKFYIIHFYIIILYIILYIFYYVFYIRHDLNTLTHSLNAVFKLLEEFKTCEDRVVVKL